MNEAKSQSVKETSPAQSSRKWWQYAAVALLLVVALSTAAYALTSITINNSSTIQAGQSIFMTQPSTANPTNCPPDGNSLYVNAPASVAWTVTAWEAAQQQFFCIDNQGTGTDNPSITAHAISLGTCPTAGGSFIFESPSGVPSTLPAHTATRIPVTIGICAGSEMSATTVGRGISFIITII